MSDDEDEYHRHPQIYLEDFYFDNTCPLQAEKHPSPEIAQVVEYFLKLLYTGYEVTPRQQYAMHLYSNDYNGNYDLENMSLTEKQLVENYMDLFDALFFFGMVSGRIDLHFDTPDPDGGSTEAYCQGSTQPHPLSSLLGTEVTIPSVKIEIHQCSKAGRAPRMIYFLNALLHEMCHAILQIFGCNKGQCIRWSNVKGQGRTGHGCAWQDLALAVETAAADYLGYDLDLDRRMAARVEISGSGNGCFRREDLRRWGLGDLR